MPTQPKQRRGTFLLQPLFSLMNVTVTFAFGIRCYYSSKDDELVFSGRVTQGTVR